MHIRTEEVNEYIVDKEPDFSEKEDTNRKGRRETSYEPMVLVRIGAVSVSSCF